MNSANNPYSTTTTNSPSLNMDVTNQFKQYKQDEKLHASKKVLPHPSEVLQEYVSELYIDLLKIKQTIKNTENEPGIKQEDINEIYSIIEEIAQKITMELPNSIDKLYL
jgi:hypothetical protein